MVSYANAKTKSTPKKSKRGRPKKSGQSVLICSGKVLYYKGNWYMYKGK